MSKIRKYIDLTLSILFVLSVISGYYKDISHMSEYCFISGLLVGITFFNPICISKRMKSPYILVYIWRVRLTYSSSSLQRFLSD